VARREKTKGILQGPVLGILKTISAWSRAKRRGSGAAEYGFGANAVRPPILAPVGLLHMGARNTVARMRYALCAYRTATSEVPTNQDFAVSYRPEGRRSHTPTQHLPPIAGPSGSPQCQAGQGISPNGGGFRSDCSRTLDGVDSTKRGTPNRG
jgi:hypothetical protein